MAVAEAHSKHPRKFDTLYPDPLKVKNPGKAYRDAEKEWERKERAKGFISLEEAVARNVAA